MKLKSLLTLGIAATLSGGFAQAAETIIVDGSPVTLDYEKGDKAAGDILHKEGNDVGSNITYELNVTQPGEYLLYLHTGNKLNSGQLHRYEVEVNGEIAAVYEFDKMLGGNWENFIMWPESVTLPAGQVTLKLTQAGQRCYINPNEAPYLIPVGKTYSLGSEEAMFDVMHADPSSAMVFTKFAAFGVDNSNFGDNKSVLVTSQDYSYNSGTKMQACYPKTKLRFLVEADREGAYPVELTGFFLSSAGGEKTNIPEFPVSIKSTWNGNDYFSSDVISNFELNNETSTATGTINLKKGVYFIEVSTDYAGADVLCLNGLKIGISEDGDTDASAVGKYTPVITFDVPANAYLGHEFTLTGAIALDQEDDVIASTALYLGDDKLGELTVGEGNTFSYKVDDLSKLTEVGDYTFNAEVTTERNFSASTSVTVNLKKQTFTINAFAGTGGSITFVNDVNTVDEGDSITCTITPDEGYDIESIKVNDDEIEFTAGADGSAIYTFENVTANQTIEASFALKTYTVTVTQSENGTITTDAADGIVEYGGSIVITLTPDKDYSVTALTIDGQNVDFTVDAQGVATYTKTDVKDNVTIEGAFSMTNSVSASSIFGDPELIVMKNNGGILIRTNKASVVNIYDITGKNILSEAIESETFLSLDTTGVLIVRVSNDNYTKDFKVIL